MIDVWVLPGVFFLFVSSHFAKTCWYINCWLYIAPRCKQVCEHACAWCPALDFLPIQGVFLPLAPTAPTRINTLWRWILCIWHDAWVILSYIQKINSKANHCDISMKFKGCQKKTGIFHLGIAKLFIQEMVVDNMMLFYWKKETVSFQCTWSSSPSSILKAFSCSGNEKRLIAIPFIII